MQTERRSSPRQGLNSLVYLDLEPDNGGILLDLSEDGMQISVANRLVTSSEIRFTLRLEPKETISGTGRVAWLSPSGRSAGVHFLGLPEEARREIRQWMGINTDSSSPEATEVLEQQSPEPRQTETPAAVAPASEPGPAAPAVEPGTIIPMEAEAAKAEIPPLPSTETPRIESPESGEAQETQPAPEPATDLPATETSPPGPADADPVPADALELLEATVEESEIEITPSAGNPATITPATAASGGDGEPSSVLSLYGIDGQEEIESGNRPEQFPEKTRELGPIVSAYPQGWTADHPAHHFRPAAESERRGPRTPDDRAARRARARARRKAAHKHPPILLSPIFVPAPPPSEFLPPPDSEKLYHPVTPPIETPSTEQTPDVPAESSTAASFSPTALPQAPDEPLTVQPGALYLPNYRVDQIAPVETPHTSWKELFRKPKDFLGKPTPHVSDIFGRFEHFGWSLESDWHVWLSLILLFAGFFSLAQNPPLIVLTIAFWIASAFVITDRRRPRHGNRQHQNTGEH